MKSFLIALQFLTRIHLAQQQEWTDEDFGGAVKFFPLTGIIIGLFLCLAYWLFSQVFATPFIVVLVVAVWLFITGGLHADGFMDTADGIFSCRDRERMLAIMKDSRVGSNGVIAFVFLVLFKITFLAAIPADMIFLVLIGVPTASRLGTLISIFEFPYARPQGLGKAFVEYAPSGTLVTGFVFSLMPALYFGFLAFLLVGAAMLTSLLANYYIVGKLGGVTGDTYGAVTEFTEMTLCGLMAVIGGITL